MKPVLIGLCGRSGTGKGYVSRLFVPYGIPSVDTDAVYRGMTGPAESLSPCMTELVAAFGVAIRLPDNSLNRPALSAQVFGEGGEASLKLLNRITHAHILRESTRLAEAYTDSGAHAVLIDAPVLFESGFDVHCRYTICVCASEDASIARIIQRDGITEEAARRRLATQIPTVELRRRCDFAIENELHCDTLPQQVAQIATAILGDLGVTV